MKPLPLSAWLLGYAGVIPFLAIFLLVCFNPMFIDVNMLGSWLLVYAAVILSFLGAVHWGVALTLTEKLPAARLGRLFYYSVAPSLLAWLAVLLPKHMAFFTMALLILFTYVADRLLLFGIIESAYQRLRLHLTVVVSVLLIATGITLG